MNGDSATGQDSITEATSSSREFAEGKSDGDHSRTRYCGCASSFACASKTRPHLFRVSLAREVLREIRNLFWRIGEIRRRALDRQGISTDPLREIRLPHEPQASALACCIRDTHNLYARERHTRFSAEQWLVHVVRPTRSHLP
jgi:hypothetical protein